MLRFVIVVAGTVVLSQLQSTLVGGGSYLPIILSVLLVLLGPMLSLLMTYPGSAILGLLDELSIPEERIRRGEANIAGQIRDLAKTWTAVSPRRFDLATVKIPNPFLRKGMEMVADGYAGEEIRRIMDKNYQRHLSLREARLNMLNSLIRLTQSFGFMGTVIGLIAVLGNLQDKADIGSGVSVALFTTLYGLLFANFIYIPMHRRYAESIRRELQIFPLITEGVMGLANRESASHIYYKLTTCLNGEAGEPSFAQRVKPMRLALAGCLFPLGKKR